MTQRARGERDCRWQVMDSVTSSRNDEGGMKMLALDALAEEATGVSVIDADSDRILAVLDRQARQWLGISGSDFLAAWQAGEFDSRDSGPVGRLVSTALLLG
jgi:hypothetical protein